MTRIILVPDNEQGAREYNLSRRMAVALIVLAVLLTIALLVLLYSYAGRQTTLVRMHNLERDLQEARVETGTVRSLQRELVESRALQEKLLRMLGVDETAAADSLESMEGATPGPPPSSMAALQRAASQAMPPEPGLWPAAGRVTREFDAGDPVNGERPHQGIDIAGQPDTPILAVAPGVVSRVGKDEYLGNYVEIRHGLGYLTVYGHLARSAVAAGDAVQGGQVIAYMGKSGQATATHLHFEIWRDDQPVDPRRYLSGEPAPQ